MWVLLFSVFLVRDVVQTRKSLVGYFKGCDTLHVKTVNIFHRGQESYPTVRLLERMYTQIYRHKLLGVYVIETHYLWTLKETHGGVQMNW